MPTLAVFSDPLLKNRDFYQTVEASTLVETIGHAYEAGIRFDQPMQIMVDGELINPIGEDGELIQGFLRLKVHPKALVVVSPQVGNPTTILFAISLVISLAASLASVFLLKQPAVPQKGLSSRSVYSFDGQTNRNRRGEPVERVYGQVKHWPSFGADFYLVGDQMYALYCIGEGKIDLIEARYENTPLDSVNEIEYEWLHPDQQVTIFDQSITQIPDITNLEIKAAHVVGSENSTYGPYIIGDVGESVTRIELDMNYPLGWFFLNNNNGDDSALNMSYRVDTREIDGNGDPLTEWVQSYRNTAARYITSPWDQTVGFDMPAARYEMRIVFDNVYSGSGRDPKFDAGGRYDSGGSEAYFRDKVLVSRVRYTSEGVAQTYPHSTMMAVNLNATNAVNGDQHRKINVDCIAVTPQITKTETTEGGAVYSFEDVPNRSIVSAFCDIFRSKHGAALADEYLDLEALYAIEERNVEEGRFFDWVFDQPISAWEAAQMVLKTCRGTPIIDGSLISAVIDGEVDNVVAFFSPHNIKAGSLKESIKGKKINDPTSLTVEYVDETTDEKEQIVCLLGNDVKSSKGKVVYAGQRNRDWAYRDGLTMRDKQKKVTRFISFETGREGFPIKFGQPFALASDVTNIGDNHGYLLNIVGTAITLKDEVDLTGLTDPVIAIRTNTGGMSGAWGITQGANSKELILDNPIPDDWQVASDAELPWFVVGDAVYEIFIASSIQPRGLDSVSVEGSIYDASVYAYDELTAPARNVTPIQPTIPDNPTVINLEVTDPSLVSLTALATWDSALGAKYYIVEVSIDGTDWTRVGTTDNTFMRVPVILDTSYVRVAGFNIGQGAWATWSDTISYDQYDLTGLTEIIIPIGSEAIPQLLCLDNEGKRYVPGIQYLHNPHRIRLYSTTVLEGTAYLL